MPKGRITEEEHELNKACKVVTDHFIKAKGIKATSALYLQQNGIAKSLINAGFLPEEIVKGIDYLIANPPRNGFSSLGYLQYVLNDILPKIACSEVIKQQEYVPDYKQYEDLNKNEQFSNAQKFQLNNKPKVKGS